LIAVATQFVAPTAPSGMVHRPRLSERLADGVDGPVTLVCGPAGSGKTTLLASTLRPERCGRVAWVSLEPDDDEPARFWDAVLTAFSRAGVPLTLPRPVAPAELVNELALLTEPLILVLDDVHHLRSLEVRDELSFLIAHLHGPLRIVLSSRADPALNLHLLRVRGALAEIRVADLAFTEPEAAQLMRAHELDIAPDLIHALQIRTEGWAAGLRLAALSLTRCSDPAAFVKAFAGDDRAVADYLLAEVLDRHSADERRFLLQTSIVTRICADLAAALTGRRRSGDRLAGLERTTGFLIAIDSRRDWYRYHRLFATLLQCRARRELRDELPDLHGRAARWYEARGQYAQALRHAAAAEDWPLVESVIVDHGLALLTRGHGRLIRRLAERLPAGNAELAAASACAALHAGDTVTGAAHIEAAIASAPALPEDRRPRYRRTLALARLQQARCAGNLDAAIAAARELPQSGGPARDALVHTELGRSALRARDFRRARVELEQGLAVARAASLDYLSVAAMSSLGLLGFLERGPNAVTHADDAVALAHRRGWTKTADAARAYVALAMAAFYGLQPDAAEQHLACARGALSATDGRQLHFLLAKLAARIAGASGQPTEGLRTLASFETRRGGAAASPLEQAALTSIRARLLAAVGDRATAETVLTPVRRRSLDVEVTAARLLLGSGDAEAALDVLQSAREAQLTGVHLVAEMEREVTEALAFDRIKDAPRADAALERALLLSEASGHRLPFLDGGPRMQSLLRDHGGTQVARARELLVAFQPGPQDRPVVAAAPLVPFTDREIALLRYLPTPLSNREIASELFVSTNTVKTHLRSIYQKLGVSRRRDAVQRARDLQLLNGGRQ
jgi:LuxR family transcriptional regulator, maltose regulon positive regulatory protein